MESVSQMLNKTAEKFLNSQNQHDSSLKTGAGIGRLLALDQNLSKNVDEMTVISIGEADALNLFDKKMSMHMINTSGDYCLFYLFFLINEFEKKIILKK